MVLENSDLLFAERTEKKRDRERETERERKNSVVIEAISFPKKGNLKLAKVTRRETSSFNAFPCVSHIIEYDETIRQNIARSSPY